MSFELKHSESLNDGIARIAAEEIDDAVERLTHHGNDLVETVHEVRKDMKKLRALLRLVRSGLRTKAFRSENECFRGIGHQLSDARDAQILIESIDKLAGNAKATSSGNGRTPRNAIDQELLRVRKELERQRGGINAMLKAKGVFERLVEDLNGARDRVPNWADAAHDWDTLEASLRRSYRRGRDAFDRAYKRPSFIHFHDWRKRVKDLHYQARMLRPLWPEALVKLSDDTGTLGDLLGDDHDFGVLARLLHANKQERWPALIEAIDAQRNRLRAQARPLGAAIYAEKPRQFSDRIAALWHAW